MAANHVGRSRADPGAGASATPPRWLWRSLLFVLGACGCLLWFLTRTAFIGTTLALLGPSLGLQATPTVVRSESRRVVRSSLPVVEAWRSRPIAIPYSAENPMMISTAHSTAVTKVPSSQGVTQLLCAIRNNDGSELWCEAGIPPVHSMVSDGRRLFVAVNWEIRAYDFATGDMLWRTEELPGHTGYDLHLWREDRLKVYSIDDRAWARHAIMRVIGTEHGAEKAVVRVEVSGDARLVLDLGRVAYWADGEEFWATEGIFGPEVWRSRLDGRVYDRPTIIRGLVLVTTMGYYSKIIAYDVGTGRIVWSPGYRFVSNIEVTDGVVYALAEDARLLALDVRTGEVLNSVHFWPAKTDVDVRTNAYHVRRAGEMLLTYFGDSQELIAFRVQD